jgi:hypothetical protein
MRNVRTLSKFKEILVGHSYIYEKGEKFFDLIIHVELSIVTSWKRLL